MGRYGKAIERTGIELSSCGTTKEAALDVLPFTHDPDPLTRRLAAKALCPCQVKADVPEVWDRLLEMTDDPDPGVRLEVVHALCDGTPRELAHQIARRLEDLYNDPDPKLRKRVRKVVSAYRKTGSVNVL